MHTPHSFSIVAFLLMGLLHTQTTHFACFVNSSLYFFTAIDSSLPVSPCIHVPHSPNTECLHEQFLDNHCIGHCAFNFSVQVWHLKTSITLFIYSGQFRGRLEVLGWDKISISIERLACVCMDQVLHPITPSPTLTTCHDYKRR